LKIGSTRNRVGSNDRTKEIDMLISRRTAIGGLMATAAMRPAFAARDDLLISRAVFSAGLHALSNRA
jgi:hypothetical protein